MKTRTKSKLFLAARAVAFASPLAAGATLTYASINGPYSLDGNTVMLYHLDETAGATTAVNAQTLSANAISINQTSTTVSGPVTSGVLGQTGFTGFGNAANFSGGLCLGYDGNLDGTFTSDTTTTPAGPDAISSTYFTGGAGEFTVEALVQTPTLSTWANGTNHEIVVADSNNATANRGFQFRMMKTSTGVVQLNYNNISKSNSNIVLNVPTSGADALADNTWYHVAAVYSGGNAAGNVRLYWTKVDPSNTFAHLLGTGLSAGTLTAGSNPIVIGNKGRWNNTTSEAFGGLIDEVRISNSARSAYQMMFAGFIPDFWQNNSGDWDDSGSWSAGVPNSATANAFFGSGSPVPPTADSTITLNGTKQVNSIQFDTAPYNFTLASGVSGALSLSSGATVTGLSGNTTIAVPVTVNTQADFSVASGGATMTLSGNISGTGTLGTPGAGPLLITGDLGATGGLNDSGSGAVTLSGTVSSTGGINNSGSGTLTVSSLLSNAGGVTNSGAGVTILSNAANSYTGATTVTNGVLRANNGAGLSTGSNLLLNGGVLETGANLARAAGTGAGAMQITGGTSGFSANGADIQVAFGTLASPTALTWGGSTFNPTTLVLNSATATNNITFLNAINLNGKAAAVQVNAQNATMSGVISDSGAGSFTKSGNGTLVLTGANTYAGATNVTGGILVANGSSLPANSNLNLNNGLFGSSLTRAIGTGAGQVQLSGGSAGFSAIGADTTVTLTNGGNAIQWGSATFNPTTLLLSSLAATNNVNLVADIDLNGAVRTVQTNSHVATMSGVVSDSSVGPTGGLTKIGTATLVLAGNNTYGGTTLVSAGTLKASGNGLSANTNLSINGGFYGSTVTRAIGTGAGQIQIPGGNSGFSDDGDSPVITLQNGGNPIVWGSATFAPASFQLTSTGPNGVTLVADFDLNGANRVFQINAGINTYAGNISNSGAAAALQFNGPGTLVLTQSNTYTGNVEIDPGTQEPGQLRAAANNALGTGGVSISPGGNATQARLELTGNITLPNAIAMQGRNNTSDAIRNISGNNTLSGTVSINSGGSSYIFQSDAGTINLTGSNGGGVAISAGATGARNITFQGAGNGTVSGIVQNGNATVSVAKAGSGSWTLSGANTYTGSTTVTAGTLHIANNLTTSSSVSVTGGTLKLDSNASFNRVIKTPTASISGGGRLDVDNNKLILTAQPVGTWNGSAYTDTTGLIASGYSPNQDFSGSGIVTSQTTATGGNTLHNVGIVSNANVGLSTFGGQSVGPNDTLVMFTYGGDANLDGAITGDDYFQIDSGFPAGASGWFNGDFNYDGVVNGDDYFVIDSNFSAQGTQIPTSGGLAGVQAVPEPASIGVVGVATASLLSRRRRR